MKIRKFSRGRSLSLSIPRLGRPRNRSGRFIQRRGEGKKKKTEKRENGYAIAVTWPRFNAELSLDDSVYRAGPARRRRRKKYIYIRSRIRQRRFYQRRCGHPGCVLGTSLQPMVGWSLTLATRHALEALIIGLHFHPFHRRIYINITCINI